MTTGPAEAYKLLVTFPPELGERLKRAAASSGRPRTHLVLDACQAAEWGHDSDALRAVSESFDQLRTLEDTYRQHFPDGRLGPPQ